MEVRLPYGNDVLTAKLPDRARKVRSAWMPQGLAPVDDVEAEVRRALAHPIDFPPLAELVKKGATVTIAFDDPTVTCFAPVRSVAAKVLLEELGRLGVRKGDIRFVCASALHRRWTRKELATVLGEDLVEEFGYRVFSHDAEDRANLSYLGTTPNGYDVEVNRLVTDSDLTIYVNASALRGLTGGWKSIHVGLSTFRSIRWHHQPDGLSAAVHDNPMHRVLDEMGDHFEAKYGKHKVFKIETILSTPLQVHKMFAGRVPSVRKEVLQVLQGRAPKHLTEEEKFDVLVYGVLNYSPYATFAGMNPILTLLSSGLGYFGGPAESHTKKGCTIIMATPCPNEWDEVHHASYREVWERVLPVTRDPWEMQDRFEEDFVNRPEYLYKYRFGYSFHPVHGLMACYPLRRLRHIGRVIVAGAKDPGLIRHVGFDTAATVEEAVGMAEEKHGKNCSVGYIEQVLG